LRSATLRRGLALLFFMAATTDPTPATTSFTTRSFFGVLRSRTHPDGRSSPVEGQDDTSTGLPMHELYHGTTMHGIQLRTGNSAAATTSYITRRPLGPGGRGAAARRGGPQLAEVGVVGLGVGSLAAYAQAGERGHVLRDRPEVAQIARDPERSRSSRTAGPATGS